MSRVEPTVPDLFRRQIQTLVENTTMALFLMDERQQCVYMNRAAVEMTGFTLDEVRGRPLHDVIHHTRPDGSHYPLAECPIDRAFPQVAREQGEEVFVHRDGHFYPVEFTASPVVEGGRPVGTVIEVRDVTAERAAQRERERLLTRLELERERLGEMLETAPALITVTRGPDHVYELVNGAARQLLGERKVIGKTIAQAFPEVVAQGLLELRDRAYVNGETVAQNEARVMVDLDGDGTPEEYFFNYVTRPLRNEAGEIDGVMTFAMDVTEQVRSRRLVEEQAAELELQTEELQAQARQTELIQTELEEANEELARRAEEAERSEDHARRLAGLAMALNEAVTPEEVADAVIENGAAALGAHRGSLALLVEDGTQFEIVRSSYTGELTDRWRRFPLDPRKPVSHAVVTGEPVLIDDIGVADAPFPSLRSDFADGDTVGFVAIPLRIRGRPIGGLSFSFPTRQHFDESDRTFAIGLGHQAAQALERARLLDSERTARTEAETANRAKTEFLSAMSHELRTPLNAIAGYVDLLDAGVHGPLTDAQIQDLERIKRAQNVLLGLINDVLNFARVEAGRMEFRDDVVQLQPLLADLEMLVGQQVRQRGLGFVCEPADAALAARGDAERIQQILLNLVSNAAKFTDAGGEIRVRAEHDGSTVRMGVSDTGRGIPADKLEAIFEPFVQLDRQSTRESQQGVGLGLAISRELARAMGGHLEATSTPGEGSEFWLVLPAG